MKGSIEITGYGSTFVCHCYSWRVPPGKRPRLVRAWWPLGTREIVLPWWLARRLDPVAVEGMPES